jgi:hypothetical protein
VVAKAWEVGDLAPGVVVKVRAGEGWATEEEGWAPEEVGWAREEVGLAQGVEGWV